MAEQRSIQESLQEYGRGIAGGLIFSLPLFYTQEVWQIALRSTPERLLIGTAAVLLLLLGYNRYAGLRPDHSLSELYIDSIEELGIGLLLAAVLLTLLGRIRFDMPLELNIRLIVLTGLLSAIGVSVGTAQLGNSEETEDAAQKQEDKRRGLFSHVVLGTCGAILIAGNVAPTGEVALLAATISPWQCLGLMAFSLLLSAVIGYYSDFTGTSPVQERPAIAVILADVILTYGTTLLVAAGLLWFFGRFDNSSLPLMLPQIVVLSVVGALGASAGKLLLQP